MLSVQNGAQRLACDGIALTVVQAANLSAVAAELCCRSNDGAPPPEADDPAAVVANTREADRLIPPPELSEFKSGPAAGFTSYDSNWEHRRCVRIRAS